MKSVSQVCGTVVFLWLAIGAQSVASRQGVEADRRAPRATGGPLSRVPVLDRAFSAEAITTVRHTLADGTRIERIATARYFRDRAGRVRIEQHILGLDALSPDADGKVRITISPGPTAGGVYTLDPDKRTVSVGPRSTADWAVGGGDTFAVPAGGANFLVFHRARYRYQRGLLASIDAQHVEEDLGTRQIAGVNAMGRRFTVTIPAGEFGNDRPMQIVDDTWESPELQLVIYSRHSDPRTGVIEYRLNNIRRVNPDPELFMIPDDYAFDPTSRDSPWIRLDFVNDRAKGAGSERRR
jgi:hypothetical protein